MARSTMLLLGTLFAGLMITGCNFMGQKAESDLAKFDSGPPTTSGTEEPSYVTVQHILIGYEGSVPGKQVTRSREQAELLALNLLERARAGADFDELVKQNTDDSHPGIYRMANDGYPGHKSANPEEAIFARGEMAGAFGNVGFPLQIGEVGLASYDQYDSPFGWHVIKRLK